MNLKLDENLSRHLKPALVSLMHDVVTVMDEGLLSQPDPIVAVAANREERMLLNLDLEFADLRKFPPVGYHGIILLRSRSLGPLFVNRFVEEFVRDTDLESLTGCVVVLDPAQIKVRRPPLETDTGKWEEISI